MARYIQGRYYKRTLDREGLGIKTGAKNTDVRTIKKCINGAGYRRCRACKKKWLSDQNIAKRWDVSDKWRHLPNWEWADWHFTDEFHMEYNARSTEWVICLASKRDCGDCIQKKLKRGAAEWHCWAIIGYNYKSRLIFYIMDELNKADAVPRIKKNPIGKAKGKKGGNITQEAYVKLILLYI